MIFSTNATRLIFHKERYWRYLRPRPHEDDCKRELFYAFRTSVHRKTMKTLTVNA